MKIRFFSRVPAIALILCASSIPLAAADHFVSPSGSHVSPFTDWNSAATNIQDAIDAATDGDTIWVTNGVYATGGKVMSGDLTNRIALDKPLTVRSVNGPWNTVILGAGATNGNAAVRCAWLTNGATLRGFTLQGGATRSPGGPVDNMRGGGVWCASPNATVMNCVIASNTAIQFGSGAFSGKLINCLVRSNSIFSYGGGALCDSTLVNSTVVNNASPAIAQTAPSNSRVTNSIVYFNGDINGSAIFDHSCTTPLPSGSGNISTDPDLFIDGVHLNSTSPCRSAGLSIASGSDIFGQAWANPPSMGCAQGLTSPVPAKPIIRPYGSPVGLLISSPAVTGDEPIYYQWLKDGSGISDNGHFQNANTMALTVNQLESSDAGNYQLVASNGSGSVTSEVARVSFRYVNAAGDNPIPPFINWATASTNIQEAINVADAGDIILVTNGVYGAGGKVMEGDLTNRVALDKPVIVSSVNGPWATTLSGSGATNGNSAVRCAWLAEGAMLHGFTLEAGATRSSGNSVTMLRGGGIWCVSFNGIVSNCIIRSNTSTAFGGGVYQGTLFNCLITGNRTVPNGAAVCDAVLVNCTVISNANWGVSTAGGLMSVTNSIVYFNVFGNVQYAGIPFYNSCTTPAPHAGSGNITVAPDFALDGIHLSNTSPCRSAGLNVAFGTDIFGRSWANPPSMGCAEWQALPSVPNPVVKFSGNPPCFVVSASGITGEEPITYRWLKDGVLIESDAHFGGTDSATLTAIGIQPNDFGHYQLIASNSWGAVTSEVAQVTFRFVNAGNSNPAMPFTSWASAATNIQDAIDAALPGEVVLVTNGVYANGGKVMFGDLTNRIAIDKAIVVQSVNGPAVTTILGFPEPTLATNGPAAIRCAWITNGATLSGFTLIGGGTRIGTSSFDVPVATGGGVFGVSTNATVADCVIATNTASYAGGGAYQVRLLDCMVIRNRLGNWDDSGPFGGLGGGGAAACDLTECVVLLNRVETRNGGGTLNCSLQNCAVIGNYCPTLGSGVFGGKLINCTVSQNLCTGNSPSASSAVYGVAATNSIIWGNVSVSPSAPTNYANSTLAYCCSDPLPPGIGNIGSDPKLLIDGFHLAPDSPCIGMGKADVTTGTDIDRQSWTETPAMGCDEWKAEPLVIVQPAPKILWGTPARLKIGGAAVAGQEPVALWWTKDGNIIEESSHFESAHSTDLILNAFGPADAGVYQLIASNLFGIATSPVVTVTVHYVDAAGANPIAPFASWETAATNIQDAIDAAAAGEFVLVTNGIYADGGKIVAGDLMNRVVLDKPLTVASVNGYRETIIRGAWDPNTTNGPLAIRAACLMRNSTLIGFTIEGGATRADGDNFTDQNGGGIWCEPNFAEYVINCNIRSNSAGYGGGGIYCGYVSNSVIMANSAQYGGGSYSSLLANSLIKSNSATVYGGGAQPFRMYNCTVVGNYAQRGGGLYLAGSPNQVMNSIIYNNDSALPFQNDQNYYFVFSPPVTLAIVKSCTTPLPIGSGNNIDADPQFTDYFRLAVTSPCRGAGGSAYASGTDLDGEPWANPPSIGCDEPVESAITGPLAVGLSMPFENVVAGKFFALSGAVSGRASRVAWEFGDGSSLTNGSFLSVAHVWTNAGNFTVSFTAYNADFPDGVSTNLELHVVPLIAPSLSLGVSNTNLSFRFPAQPGLLYWLEQTATLAPPNWQIVTGMYATNSTVEMVQPVAVDPMRFYRIRIQ